MTALMEQRMLARLGHWTCHGLEVSSPVCGTNDDHISSVRDPVQQRQQGGYHAGKYLSARVGVGTPRRHQPIQLVQEYN